MSLALFITLIGIGIPLVVMFIILIIIDGIRVAFTVVGLTVSVLGGIIGMVFGLYYLGLAIGLK